MRFGFCRRGCSGWKGNPPVKVVEQNMRRMRGGGGGEAQHFLAEVGMGRAVSLHECLAVPCFQLLFGGLTGPYINYL